MLSIQAAEPAFVCIHLTIGDEQYGKQGSRSMNIDIASIIAILPVVVRRFPSPRRSGGETCYRLVETRVTGPF